MFIEIEKNNSSLLIEVFEGFESIYGKFFTEKNLKREYI